MKAQNFNLRCLLSGLMVCVMVSVIAGQQKRTKVKSGTKATPVATSPKDYARIYKDSWTLAAEGIGAGPLYYFNAHTATRKGNIIRIWTQSRRNTVDSVISKMLDEYDCEQKKSRTIAAATYQRVVNYPDGRREWIDLSPPDSFDDSTVPFTFIFPDSIGAAILEAVCKL